MKNCDEMVNSLFERREQYVAQQTKRRKVFVGTVASMCCVCLVTMVGLGIWQSGMFHTPQLGKKLEDEQDTNNNFDKSNVIDHKIIIHSIKGISYDRMNICLSVDDFVEMTREEMMEYYGVDYIPDVPADIKPWENERSGIYKRNGGIGEVYWDRDILNFSNEDFMRDISIEVDKGVIPWLDYLIFDREDEKSIINGIEVLIGQNDDGYYYAEFMFKNVGFTICAKGLTQDEFVSVIASIIK